jgi:hypothetical protein
VSNCLCDGNHFERKTAVTSLYPPGDTDIFGLDSSVWSVLHPSSNCYGFVNEM